MSGGRAFVTGIGVSVPVSPGAITVKWTAGADSCMDDVYIDYRRRGRGRHADAIWVTDGGGGTFKSIWTAAPQTTTGLRVSNTSTPGRVYMMSVEHHAEREVLLENVENWSFYGLQTEENLQSPKAMAIDIVDCANLRFLNLFLYRVMAFKHTFPFGVRLRGSRRIAIRGLRCFSWGEHPFANTLLDADIERYVTPKEIARLEIRPTAQVSER